MDEDKDIETTPVRNLVVALLWLLLSAAGWDSAAAPAHTRAAAPCEAALRPTLTTVRPHGDLRLEGDACARGKVRFEQRRGRSWVRLGSARTRAGLFSACVRVRRSAGVRRARLREVVRGIVRAEATIRISDRAREGCGLHLLKQDPATNPNPYPLWGDIDAVSPSRHQWFPFGGPAGGPFRRMTALDGDLYHGDSERAELGNSGYQRDWRGRLQTFYLYRTGTRRITSFWMRLPPSFPIHTHGWQVVMQMKQTDPATNADGTPILALQAASGVWMLKQSGSPGPSETTRVLWKTPATIGVWTPISVDATYSADPRKGRVQITIGGVSSPVFHTYTLKLESSPPGPGLRPGDPIPSHLRLGIYHDPRVPGTHVDLTQVRVLG